MSSTIELFLINFADCVKHMKLMQFNTTWNYSNLQIALIETEGGGGEGKGGVRQCRKRGKLQNNLHAFSKEREITGANYQRKSLQFRRQKCLQLQIKQLLWRQNV